MKRIPKKARTYLFWSAFLLAFPSLASLYHGHTGKFLVSTAHMRGTPFDKSVVYLNYHDFWGAQGVIINKPIKGIDLPPDMKDAPELKWNVDLYYGGPVGFPSYTFLQIPDKSAKAGFDIVSVESLRRQRPDVIKDMDAHNNKRRLRIYFGFSGWIVMQLNRELFWGAWGVTDFDSDIMFKTKPGEMSGQSHGKGFKRQASAHAAGQGVTGKS